MTADGRSGTILHVAPLAAVGFKQEQEPAQDLIHNMAERSVKEMQNKPESVTKSRVVSRIKLLIIISGLKPANIITYEVCH